MFDRLDGVYAAELTKKVRQYNAGVGFMPPKTVAAAADEFPMKQTQTAQEDAQKQVTDAKNGPLCPYVTECERC